MQSSQRMATEMPSAMSSLVLLSSAFGATAACARPEKAFITSGVSPRSVRMCPTISLVNSGQFFIRPSPCAGPADRAISYSDDGI